MLFFHCLHKRVQQIPILSRKKFPGKNKILKRSFQNIHDCKICTKIVEGWGVSHILSSKLYTLKIVENSGKVELYTELSTLSTKIHKIFFDLHNERKNIGFVKLL